MKTIFKLFLLTICILLFATSCQTIFKSDGISKEYLRFSRTQGTNLEQWDFVSIPEGYVACKSGNDVFEFGPFSFAQFSSDYETRTVNVTVYGSNSKEENDLRKIIEEHLNNKFQNLNEVMHDTEINIEFEHLEG
jgi:hypothetical protein